MPRFMLPLAAGLALCASECNFAAPALRFAHPPSSNVAFCANCTSFVLSLYFLRLFAFRSRSLLLFPVWHQRLSPLRLWL